MRRGFDDGKRLAWIDNWSSAPTEMIPSIWWPRTRRARIHLHLRAAKSPVVHGENGVSVKVSASGHASHYYSNPRLETTGEILVDGKSHPFRGRELVRSRMGDRPTGGGSGRLGLDLSAMGGWDGTDALPNAPQEWRTGFELERHLDRADGTIDSSAQLGFSDDADRILEKQSERRAISDRLARDASGSSRAEFVVRAVLEDQELALGPITYWEGAIDATGTRDGKAIKGRGYLELTGYAGRVEMGR